jgi:Immunity protein 8
MVCSPEWLQQQSAPMIGRHHLIVRNFSYADLVAFVEDYLQGCEGVDWKDVANKVGRLGRWEFEDYRD